MHGVLDVGTQGQLEYITDHNIQRASHALKMLHKNNEPQMTDANKCKDFEI